LVGSLVGDSQRKGLFAAEAAITGPDGNRVVT
jgi:hypothetical protein